MIQGQGQGQGQGQKQHFFIDAPILSWMQWTQRRIFSGTPKKPSLIPSTLSKTTLPVSPKGIQSPERAKVSSAHEYSEFLATHFYPSSSSVQLCIPPSIFQKGIQEGYIVGVEMRDTQKTLVGVLFYLYAGLYENEKMGLITWHCVQPAWRKIGISNCMLRSIYIFTQPHSIYWFRNDGWLKTIVPPTCTEQYIYRKKRTKHVFSSNQIDYSQTIQKRIQRVPYEKWHIQLKEDWVKKHPDGLILDDTTFKNRFVEVWEYEIRKGVYEILVLQPTFEKQRHSQNEYWCEVITWLCHGTIKSEYENAHYIETILDAVPYTWFEASNKMPHLENDWLLSCQNSWSAFGLDTGVPVLRSLLPLCIC